MKDKYLKEGFASGSVSAIITMIVGVGIGVLSLIFVGSLGGQTYNLVEADINAIGNNVVTTESFTAVNGTAVNLANSAVQNGTLVIWNSTNTIELVNFTINYNAGAITALNDLYNNTALSANYTWGAAEIRQSVQAGVVSSFDALQQTGDYLPIVVLAVVITLVMAMVMSIGGLGGKSGGTAL